ncbi:MAG: hypothetical protein HEEMFOPI_01487 [Holosporales bacterium]
MDFVMCFTPPNLNYGHIKLGLHIVGEEHRFQKRKIYAPIGTGVGFLQFAPSFNPYTNVETILDFSSHVRNSIIVLPEYFLSLYDESIFFDQKELLNILSPVLHISQANNISFFGSIPFLSKKGIRNRGIYIKKGKIFDWVDKHLVSPHEKIISGKINKKIFYFNNIAFSPQICLDLIDPLPTLSATRNKGISFLLISCGISVNYLSRIAAVRAMENQIFSILSNRSCSLEEELKFSGESSLFLPNGESLSVNRNENKLLIMDMTREIIAEMEKNRKRLTGF